MKFTDFPLNQTILQTLESMGFVEPTPIQAQTLPVLLENPTQDFFGKAQTGTGKTYAFGLPLLQAIEPSTKKIQSLIVAPTRELVTQITESLNKVARPLKISVEAVYGGVSIDNQIRALKKGPHIIVGTPGRIRDHLKRKTLDLSQLKTLILDEADIMLEMGFKEEVDHILTFTPENRTIWLFSATVKPGVSAILKSHMKNPISVRMKKEKTDTAQTEQFYAITNHKNRFAALCRFIDATPFFYGFIFCRTKSDTADVAEKLSKIGYPAKALHGDMNQRQRNVVIKAFKEKEFPILVATDVAARGIDVSDLTHVINYSFPEDYESYIHRIGRTGRAGKKGTAITFINKSDLRHIDRLEHQFNVRIHPTDIPTIDDIAGGRVEKVKEFMEKSGISSSESTPYHKQIRELLQDYKTSQLAAVVESLLYDKFFKDLKTMEDRAGKVEGISREERRSHRFGGRDQRRSSSGSGKRRFSNRRSERRDDDKFSGRSKRTGK